MEIILLLIAITGLIFSIVYRRNSKKNFKQKMQEQGFDIGIRDIVYRYGLPNMVEHSVANVYANDEKLVIEHKDLKYQIDFPQLTAIEFVNKVDQLEKNKSPLARGIAGGLVLGPLGAISGAASGVGTKKEKGGFVVINYKSEGEIKPIILQVRNGVTSLSETTKFVKEIRSKIIKLNTEDGVIKL